MSYSTIVFNDSPRLWWQLNDSAAPLIDASGYGNTATVNHLQLKVPGGPPVTEMSCAAFNGSTTLLTSNYSPTILSQVSVEGWVNFSGTSGTQYIWFWDVAASGIGYTAGTLFFALKTAAGTGSTSLSWTPVVGDWYHIVGTWDGETMHVYINGVIQGSHTFVDSGPLLCSDSFQYGLDFNGLSSNAAVYDYALTSAQVQQHYTAAQSPLRVPADAYTVNLCPNPGFLVGLDGYEALPNSGIALSSVSLSGPQAMVCETDGLASGEGFSAPVGVVPSFAPGSIQLELLGGSGSLTVGVYANPSDIEPLASIPVVLTDSLQWQRVVLNDIPLLEGQEMYITVSTTTPQILTFYVDCVQYEPESPCHPYIDGESPFCTWTSTPGDSVSFQQFQFPTGSAGVMTLGGKTIVPVEVGKSFDMAAIDAGTMKFYSDPGYVITAIGNPVGAFDDFAIFQLTDIDPAQSYVSWNNAGTSSGQTNYNRIYGLIYAPAEYPTSDTTDMWKAGRYMASGWQFGSLGAGQTAEITQIQAELMPYLYGTNPVPSAYDTPRQIHTVVKPARLNYCINPSGAVDASSWVPIAGITGVARSSVNSASVSGALDLFSIVAQVNDLTNQDGIATPLYDLIVGDVYTVSAWVMSAQAGFFDISMSCGGVTASSFSQGSSYGEGGFGDGPYGGVNTVSDMPSNVWYRATLTFTARYNVEMLSFQPQVNSGTFSSTGLFYVDAMCAEPGEVAGDYFDGSFTPDSDYMWEQGGTPGLSRSYYYPRLAVAEGAVTTTLTQHTPLGVWAAAPQYGLPPTQ